ncbi:hypothetical protein ACFL1B_01760 [Nanoarchaeota archaeon]
MVTRSATLDDKTALLLRDIGFNTDIYYQSFTASGVDWRMAFRAQPRPKALHLQSDEPINLREDTVAGWRGLSAHDIAFVVTRNQLSLPEDNVYGSAEQPQVIVFSPTQQMESPYPGEVITLNDDRKTRDLVFGKAPVSYDEKERTLNLLFCGSRLQVEIPETVQALYFHKQATFQPTEDIRLVHGILAQAGIQETTPISGDDIGDVRYYHFTLPTNFVELGMSLGPDRIGFYVNHLAGDRSHDEIRALYEGLTLFKGDEPIDGHNGSKIGERDVHHGLSIGFPADHVDDVTTFLQRLSGMPELISEIQGKELIYSAQIQKVRP